MNSKEKQTPEYSFDFEHYALGSNLAYLMKLYKISIVQLHKNTNVPLTTLKRIKYDQEANPTMSSLIPIAQFFAITLNQLIGLDPLPTKVKSGIYFEKRENWINIPLIQWNQIIHWPGIKDSLTQSATISTDICISTNAYALQIENEDFDCFLQNSYLIIDPSKNPRHKSYAIVEKNECVTVMQTLIHDKKIYLKPLQSYLKIVEHNEHYAFKGIVAQVRMDTLS